MVKKRDRAHLIVPFEPRTHAYTSSQGGARGLTYAGPPDRTKHGQELLSAYKQACEAAKDARAQSSVQLRDKPTGIRIEFEGPPGETLKLESLGHASKHIEVLAVSYETVREGDTSSVIERATVFIPDEHIKYFIDRFEQYIEEPDDGKKRPNQDAVDRIAALRRATLRALWTDSPELFPKPRTPIWWEVWLRASGGKEVERFYEYADLAGLRVHERRLHFTDRVVLLAYGTLEQMVASNDVLDDLAELQRSKETAAFFVTQPASEQALWINNLLERTEAPPDNALAVCVLDTGVNRGHPLLSLALSATDCLTVDPTWETHDHDDRGHGTATAGLALYGDLREALASSSPVKLRHRLESVKILPPDEHRTKSAHPVKPEAAVDSYGAVTAEAISRAEAQNSTRERIYATTVTALDSRDRGQPTSWSAAIDALAAGRSFDISEKSLLYIDDAAKPRLLVLAAGNGESRYQPDVLTRADTELVEDPAQAWNAIAVGAYTDMISFTQPSLTGYHPASPRGELSPWTTTSVSFSKEWPNKPDVVMEGGNAAVDPTGVVLQCEDLSLLAPSHEPFKQPLAMIWATSAAAPQVARIAAEIAAEYSSLWPETIRALVVHSARWTAQMKQNLDAHRRKRERARIFRRYGYGVPDRSRAIRSARDSATLIVQGSIRPFKDGAMNEIQLHELPWPKETLRALVDAKFTLKVTLSYFIEPNPGRRGWRNRYRYPSHGLRFDLISPTEDIDAFHKRLNKKAREDGEPSETGGKNSAEWYLGTEARNRGSLHSDYIFDITAADLADRNTLAVYPVGGWWKDAPNRDRSKLGARYALIVSLETDEVDADIWTPIADQIGVPVTVDV